MTKAQEYMLKYIKENDGPKPSEVVEQTHKYCVPADEAALSQMLYILIAKSRVLVKDGKLYLKR